MRVRSGHYWTVHSEPPHLELTASSLHYYLISIDDSVVTSEHTPFTASDGAGVGVFSYG